MGASPNVPASLHAASLQYSSLMSIRRCLVAQTKGRIINCCANKALTTWGLSNPIYLYTSLLVLGLLLALCKDYLTDYGRPIKLFALKSQTFGLGQTILAENFWGIWGILGWFISTHFGTVSPLSMLSNNQSLFLQKSKPLYPNPKYLFGMAIWIRTTKN